MAQHDIQLPTTPPLSGTALINLLNEALLALGTDFAGNADPTSYAGVGPYMTWADTLNRLIKRRNEANSAWVVEGKLLQNNSPDATTGLRGLVELATDAETQTGTDAERAVTPAGLSSRTATESSAGIVELATDAEAIAIEDTARALVPANLAAIFGGGTLGSNGHFELPVVIAGARVLVIVNYGVVGVAAAGGSSVTFDKEFPTAVLMTQATIKQSGGVSAAFAAGVGNETTAGMTVFNNGNGGTTPVAWFAVGY